MISLLITAILIGATQTVERAGVVATAKVEPDTVAIIGAVTVTLSVEAVAPLAVELPAGFQPPGWSLVASEEPKQVVPPSGPARWTQSWRFSPDRPGERPLTLPSLAVRAAGRMSVTEIAWPAFTVRVTSTIADPSLSDVADLAPAIWPERSPPAPIRWPWLLIPPMVAAGIWWWLRKPKPRAEPPLEEVANARLRSLATGDFEGLERNLRSYLAKRFGLPAEQSTCEELEGRLGEPWRKLLADCELARFMEPDSRPAPDWATLLMTAQSLLSSSLTPGEPFPLPKDG